MSTQDNVRSLRDALEAWNHVNRRNEYYSIYAPDAVIHAHDVTTVEALREFYNGFASAFPDANVTLDEVVAEGDKVAYKVSLRATHQGFFGGLPATGKRILLNEVGFLDFSKGKIVKRWAIDNAQEIVGQLKD